MAVSLTTRYGAFESPVVCQCRGWLPPSYGNQPLGNSCVSDGIQP